MTEDKKPDSHGPVVIRKGHVKPPPPGAKIEAPVVETIESAPEAGARATDRRPLWQRLAEEKATARTGGPASGPPLGCARLRGKPSWSAGV